MSSPKTVKAMMVEEIRKRILRGHLRQEHKINQDALAAELGVSKLPIREALIVLENEGLVQNVPRRGAFVAGLSPEDILDHYRIFSYASGLAAERAAEQLSDEEVARLRVLVDHMDEDVDDKTMDELNYEFHSIINKASHSARLISVIRSLGRTLPTRSFEPLRDFSRRANHDHRIILDGLVSKDVKTVQEVIDRHFAAVATLTIEYFEEDGFWPNKQ
jgi:DNA-binding GntR family transcriptional regulator